MAITSSSIVAALTAVQTGGVFLLAAGDAAGIGAVAAGSADTLRIANSSGATATYQIGFLARTA